MKGTQLNVNEICIRLIVTQKLEDPQDLIQWRDVKTIIQSIIIIILIGFQTIEIMQ